MKTFQIIVFLIILPSSRADDLTPSTCEIDTSANNDGDRTIELTAGENKNGIKTVDFTLHGTAFKLDLARPAYVKVTIAANVNKIECSFVGAGLTITAVISTVDTPITIKPGDSVGILFGDKTVKIAHDKAKRDFVPINVEVVKGEVDPTTAQLTLTGAVKPTVKLTTKSDNWLVVPKEQLEAAGDNIDVALTIPADGVVVVTNLLGVKPMIALNKKSSFTCFAKQCSMGIEKKEDVLLEVEILQDVESDKPKFEVGSTKTETIDLRKDYLEVIKELKSEMPATLDCTFSSDLKQILTPPTIAISNLANTGEFIINKNNVHFRGKSSNGILKVPQADTNVQMTVLTKDNEAKKADIDFEVLNPDAVLPEDFLKTFHVDNTQSELYLFKDMIYPSGKLRTSIKTETNKRATIMILKKPMEAVIMKPGYTELLTKKRPGVIRKHPGKDTTLIFQLDGSVKEDTTKMKINEIEYTIGKDRFYNYLTPEDFKGKTEIFCEPQDDNAVVSYSRIESKVPFVVRPGSQTLYQEGDFVLSVADPAEGATLRVKGLKGSTEVARVEVVLNRKGSDGKPMTLQRGIDGSLEEFLFIYPEDLGSMNELQGKLAFKDKNRLEVVNTKGIEKIKVLDENWVVRKTPAELNIGNPNEDHVVYLEFLKDSQADSITFEIDGKKHTVDRKTTTATVLLSKEFLAKNPSPSAKFTTNPPDLDGHVSVRIKKESAPPPKTTPAPTAPPAPPAPPKECKPACQGYSDCVQEGDKMECFCKPGYQGDKCEQIPAGNPCRPGPCKNYGTCTHVKEQEFTCKCRNGFEGTTCEIKDPCTPNPCLNKGVCAQNGASFKCTCTVDFKGAICKDKNASPTIVVSLLSVVVPIIIAFLMQ